MKKQKHNCKECNGRAEYWEFEVKDCEYWVKEFKKRAKEYRNKCQCEKGETTLRLSRG